ncbi:MAG TPA: TRAP transporter substrate-binding protein DctP [Paracoccus solventivorans]|uniref:TRAP transporter substrate-binding protein DctP n=1 Tax=Paracoccus solventivorans TaxID=53463 RepID=A0A832PMC3_9RHOB|nr:TRAP transporter substrate-binding protein DctP [Paracoccus solventivorans]HHW33681.1 TRAP transporter substrate-binding protein DctP [Paracoccus solventivorans]
MRNLKKLLGVAVISVSVAGSAVAEEYVLRISQVHSRESATFKDVTLPVKEFIERESGGRITVQTYPNGVLHGAADAFKAIVTGVTDVAPAYPLFNSSSFHLAHGFFLPSAFETAYANNQVKAELYDEYIKPEYAALGVEVFMHGTSAPYQLLTTVEVRSLGDVKGLKIRGSGGAVNEMVAALGATPVTISSAEMYSAFQQGVVDGVLVPAESITTYHLEEVAKYFVPVDFGRAGDIPFAINAKVYDNLPEDLAEVVKRAGQYGNVVYGDFVEKNTAAGMDALRAKGVKMVELSDADVATLDRAKQVLWDDFLKKNEADGYPASEFVAALKSLSSEFGAMDRDAMLERQSEVGK